MGDSLRARRSVRVAALVLVIGSALAFAAPQWVPAAVAASPGPALLTQVEAKDMGTFDRVTFSFRTVHCIDFCSGPADNPVPVIARAEFVDRPVLADPSGEEVEVGGNAVLQIVMSNASGVDLSVDPRVSTYTGPGRLQPGLPNVVDVVETGDFESVLSWAIGVRSGAVSVTTVVLTDSTRVVVDVPHAAASPVVAPPSFTG